MTERKEFNEYLFFRAVEIYNKFCRNNENMVHWSDAQVFRDRLPADYRTMEPQEAVNAVFSVFDRHLRIRILQREHSELFRENVDPARSFSALLDVPSIVRDYQMLKDENFALISPYDPYYRNLDAVRSLGVELGVMKQDLMAGITGGNLELVSNPAVILNHYRGSKKRQDFVNFPDRRKSLSDLINEDLIDSRDRNWQPLLLYRQSELARNNYNTYVTPGSNFYGIRDIAGITRLTSFMERKAYQKGIRFFSDDVMTWWHEKNWMNPTADINGKIEARAAALSRTGKQLQYLFEEGYQPVFQTLKSGPYKGQITASFSYGLSDLSLTVMDIDRNLNRVGSHIRKDGRNIFYTYGSAARTGGYGRSGGSFEYESRAVWASPEESLDLLKFAMGRYDEMSIRQTAMPGVNRMAGKDRFKSYTILRTGQNAEGSALVTYREAQGSHGSPLLIREDVKNIPVHMFNNDSYSDPYVYSNRQIYDRLSGYLKEAKEEFARRIDLDSLYETVVSNQKYPDLETEPEYSQNTLVRKIQKSFYNYMSMKTDSFIQASEIKRIEMEKVPAEEDTLQDEKFREDDREEDRLSDTDLSKADTPDLRRKILKSYISLKTSNNLIVQLFGSSFQCTGESVDTIRFDHYNSDNKDEGRYLLNPALVAEYATLQNGTGYGLKLDIMRMCRYLGMKPKNLDRSNQDNIDLANELVFGKTDYENPESDAMDMLHLQDPSTHKKWYRELGAARQQFVNKRIETVKNVLLNKGALADGARPLAGYGISEAPHSMKIIMDGNGVVSWQADFIIAAGVDTAIKNVRENNKTRWPYITFQGSIGQIAVPYVNNMIKTPYISKDARYLVPAYHGTLARQKNDGLPQQSVAQLTRIDDYGSLLDAALSQSVSDQVARLQLRHARSHDYETENYEQKHGFEKGTSGSVETLQKRNLTMDESTRLNKVLQKLDIVERMHLDQPEHDRLMNLSREDRSSISEMQTSVIKYDTSLNQKAYLSAQVEQNKRFLSVSHYMTRKEFDRMTAADDSFFDQLVQIGNTPLSLLNIRGVKGRLDPILGGTGPQIGSERYLVKGAKIENRKIVPSQTHTRAPIYYVKGFENLKFDGVERQAIVAKEFTHCLSMDRNVNIAFGPLGGWNMEDAIVISSKFAKSHPVEILKDEENRTDLTEDGAFVIRTRPLRPGDKIDNGHGNKGVVSFVADPEMDMETAEEQGVGKLIQFFKDNPDLDMVCSSTTWTRNNVGGAVDGISGKGDNCADLIVRDDQGNPQTVKGGMITNGTVIITDKTVEGGTHYHMDPNYDGRTGSKKGIFSISALEGFQMYETIKSIVDTNEREWDRTREYLMACGFFMDANTKFSPVYQCAHGGAADRIPNRPVLTIDEYLHVSGTPLSLVVDEKKMLKAFHDKFAKTGGFIEVSFPLDYVHYKNGSAPLQTYPLLPDKSRPCQTEEEFLAAGFVSSGNAWIRDPEREVSKDVYPDGKVTYAFPVIAEEYRSGHLTESGSVIDSAITAGYLNLMRDQVKYVIQGETAEMFERMSLMNGAQRKSDTALSSRCRFSIPKLSAELERRSAQVHQAEIERRQKAAAKKFQDVEPWRMSSLEAAQYGIKLLTEVTRNRKLMTTPHLFSSKTVSTNPWYQSAGDSKDYQKKIAQRFFATGRVEDNPYSIAASILNEDRNEKTASKIRQHSASVQKRIFDKFTCKKNLIKEQTFAPRANNTGFIIAVPDPRNKIGEVTLSKEVSDTLKIHEGQTVLCYRDPTWRSEGFWAARVRIDHSENAPGIGINPAIAQRSDADFDGDHIGVIKAPSAAVEKEWQEKAMVHQHLVDMTRCTDDPQVVSSVYTRYKKLERDYNARNGTDINLPPFETVGGLSLNLGSDIALGMNHDPALRKKADQLHADALVNHIAYEQQIRNREDFETEALRIADSLDDVIQSACFKACGTNFLSFENTEAHLQSVYDHVVETGMKGKEKDLVKYAACLARNIDIEDGQVIVRSRLNDFSQLPVNSYAQNKTALLGLAMKTEAAGYAGKTGQTIQAPAASERRYDKASYLVNQVVQQLAQCNLQMKKTPEKAPASLFIIGTALPDLLNGGPLKRYDEDQKMYVNANDQPFPNAQTAIDCAYEMVTSKNGLGLTVSREIFQMAMENLIISKEGYGSVLHVNESVGREGVAYDLCYNFTDAAGILTKAARTGQHLVPPQSRLNIFRPESDGRKSVSLEEDRKFLAALGLDKTPECEPAKDAAGFENTTELPKTRQLSELIRNASKERTEQMMQNQPVQAAQQEQKTAFESIDYRNSQQEEVKEILYPF